MLMMVTLTFNFQLLTPTTGDFSDFHRRVIQIGLTHHIEISGSHRHLEDVSRASMKRCVLITEDTFDIDLVLRRLILADQVAIRMIGGDVRVIHIILGHQRKVGHADGGHVT